MTFLLVLEKAVKPVNIPLVFIGHVPIYPSRVFPQMGCVG